MTRHSKIFLALICSAALAAMPSSALAGSLLSGYGAPGGGSQAILGSALLNGGGGGSGGSGGEGSSGSGGGSLALATGAPGGQGTVGQGAGRPGASTRSGGAHADGAKGTGSDAGASGRGSSTYTSTGSPRSSARLAGAADSDLMSFTETDLLLLVLVLGVLTCTAGFTRALARTQHY